ncbi:hypothetical protein SDC9_179940 [bioreactor metagenome]|uniref:Uncharacterized protein n=1 Tax=bioreactor metagenome TaxID=1076179 RepID=A0A645H288_9ZZZZ
MEQNSVRFANLSAEQLNELKQFEAVFNSKHGNHVFLLAFGEK